MAEEFKHIVRIANTDLKGEVPIGHALRQIKGVNFMFANLLCKLSKIDKNKKAGVITDSELNKLDAIIKDPSAFNAPDWMFNRRRDPETGKTSHIEVDGLASCN